jgi:hypothetical protein
MTFSRYVLLWLLAACGSQHAPTPEPRVGNQGSGVQPVPARPVAVAIVFEGWELWVGNDRLPDVPDAERYPGALRPFEDAFARVPLTGFPTGSRATIVTYTDRASVRHPMDRIENLAAAAFGDQKDYLGVIDRDLVGGVTLGLNELAKVTDARRILVVIGDGSDTNNETAKGALAALAKRAATENVELLSIVYKGPLSSDATPIRALDPSARVVNTADAIADEVGWLFTRLKQRPVVGGGVGGKPVALAFLVSGWEVWMGNDEIVPANDPSRYTGTLKSIRAAFDRAPMTGFPDGSKAMVATYDSSSRIRLPMGPIESLDARAVGVQRDYYGTVGVELVSGVTLALTELAKVEGARRVLVVVGDGSDANPDAAKLKLADLAKRAAEFHIEVHAIVYKASLSGEATVVTLLDPKASTVASTDAITAELVALFKRLRTPK